MLERIGFESIELENKLPEELSNLAFPKFKELMRLVYGGGILMDYVIFWLFIAWD